LGAASGNQRYTKRETPSVEARVKVELRTASSFMTTLLTAAVVKLGLY
jgi:hypothetical protein